jgi:hypothetical protein
MAHYNLQIWENGKSKGLLEVKDFHLSINLGGSTHVILSAKSVKCELFCTFREVD